MLKKLLIAVAVLVVVLVAAAVALVTLVDVNRFKPQIEQLVQDRYQRTLRIDGDLGLALFPRIALSLPHSTLSEPGGKGEAASIGGAKVSVAVMPLLRGEVVAEKLTVDRLKASVERRADGSLTIDDLIGKADRDAEPATPSIQPSSSPTSSNDLPRLDLGGLKLTGAQIAYKDLQTGSTLSISNVDLDVGRIANAGETPIDLKFGFAATQPNGNGEVALKATAVYDLAARVFGAKGLDLTAKGITGTTKIERANLKLATLAIDPARMTIDTAGLDLTAKGRLAADPFEARVTVPRFALDETSASGDALQATFKVSGSRVVDARVDLSGIGGSSNALTIAKLALDATAKQGERSMQVRLETPVKANLPAGTVELPSLAATILIDDPALPQKSATIELKGSVSADSQKEKIAANLDAKAEGTALVAKVTVDRFRPPRIGFDVKADQLDIDRLLPPVTSGQAGGVSSGGGAGVEKDTPVDLSALADLDLDGKLSVGRLQVRGIKATEVNVVMKAAKGRLDVAPVGATLYGGRLAAKAGVKAGATPAANRIDTTIDLTGISIGPLLKDVADKDLLEGRGNVKVALATSGGSVNAMKRALDGTGALDLRDGAIKGINLADSIRSARSLLQGGQAEKRASDPSKKTDFTAMTVSFVIKNGIATSNDLDLRSPLFRVGGEGRADIGASRLDYTVRASVVASSAGQGGKELADLSGVTIPVRLAGPFDKLDWEIDWQTVGKEALKSRAASELKERLNTDELEKKAREKLGEQLGDKLGDSLKGLFKR